MNSDTPAPEPPVPTLNRIARRLIRFSQTCSLEESDLIQEARCELWNRRDEIASRPDPVATSYTTARRVMWAAVQRANAGH